VKAHFAIGSAERHKAARRLAPLPIRPDPAVHTIPRSGGVAASQYLTLILRRRADVVSPLKKRARAKFKQTIEFSPLSLDCVKAWAQVRAASAKL
jgi:hypothetical protein